MREDWPSMDAGILFIVIAVYPICDMKVSLVKMDKTAEKLLYIDGEVLYRTSFA
jgi:hypothetical protein